MKLVGVKPPSSPGKADGLGVCESWQKYNFHLSQKIYSCVFTAQLSEIRHIMPSLLFENITVFYSTKPAHIPNDLMGCQQWIAELRIKYPGPDVPLCENQPTVSKCFG